jgi:predicted nucleotidyltransferase
MTENFKSFRNKILKALDAYGIKYKLFGGAAVCLINEDRETEDLDIAIKANQEIVEDFIDALVYAGYDSQKSLREQIYGINKQPHNDLYSTCRILPSKSEWEGFYIDLCFTIGEHNYDNMPSEIYTDNGLDISIVTFEHIARMKANIFPNPRPEDIEDIQIIAKHLGLDPATGEPRKEEKPSIWKRLKIFGGGNQ